MSTNRRDACFRDLNMPFFDDGIMSRLTAFAQQRISDGRFLRYDSYRTAEEFAEVGDELPEISELCASCFVGCRPLLMFLPPGFSMDIHRDVHFLDTRRCCIGVIAYPADGIAPTRFYDGEDRGTFKLQAEWQVGRPKLLNIQQWHNVDNGDTWRANLQLSLDMDYDGVVELASRNRLFDGHGCFLS